MSKREFTLSEDYQQKIAYDAIRKLRKMANECKTVRERVIVENYAELLLNRLDEWDLAGNPEEPSVFEIEYYKAKEEFWARKELW